MLGPNSSPRTDGSPREMSIHNELVQLCHATRVKAPSQCECLFQHCLHFDPKKLHAFHAKFITLPLSQIDFNHIIDLEGVGKLRLIMWLTMVSTYNLFYMLKTMSDQQLDLINFEIEDQSIMKNIPSLQDFIISVGEKELFTLYIQKRFRCELDVNTSTHNAPSLLFRAIQYAHSGFDKPLKLILRYPPDKLNFKLELDEKVDEELDKELDKKPAFTIFDFSYHEQATPIALYLILQMIPTSSLPIPGNIEDKLTHSPLTLTLYTFSSQLGIARNKYKVMQTNKSIDKDSIKADFDLLMDLAKNAYEFGCNPDAYYWIGEFFSEIGYPEFTDAAMEQVSVESMDYPKALDWQQKREREREAQLQENLKISKINEGISLELAPTRTRSTSTLSGDSPRSPKSGTSSPKSGSQIRERSFSSSSPRAPLSFSLPPETMTGERSSARTSEDKRGFLESFGITLRTRSALIISSDLAPSPERNGGSREQRSSGTGSPKSGSRIRDTLHTSSSSPRTENPDGIAEGDPPVKKGSLMP